MEQRDIHEGVNLEASFQYREICQQNYWDAMDRVESARIALAGINNHIQKISTKEHPDGTATMEIAA